MTSAIYLEPITFVASPQAASGEAVRLAGGMIHAREFALIVREAGRVTERLVLRAPEVEAALARLPQALAPAAAAQWANLARSPAPLVLGERTIRLDQPQVVGILNTTPDSFSDGGRFMDAPGAMQEQAAVMHEAGAAIIDIGGESTRPGAAAIWEGEEIRRVVPAIEWCAGMGAVVSVDTRRPAVMEAALRAGASILNDVSALRHDPRSLGFAAMSGAPVILMHAPGPSREAAQDLHRDGRYDAIALDVFDWLAARRDAALAAGIARERIILDPGIGFGKSLAENLGLINHLALFHALGQPLMLGASRKRLIGALSNEVAAQERLGGSLALALAGMAAGFQLLRVHDVFATVQARNVWRGLRDAALTDFTDLPA